MRAIVGDRSGYLLAAAFPPILYNFVVGQNGFLSAGRGARIMLRTSLRASALLACLLVLIFLFVNAPVGFGAILVVAGLVGRRAVRAAE
jgi:hypothetical protein